MVELAVQFDATITPQEGTPEAVLCPEIVIAWAPTMMGLTTARFTPAFVPVPLANPVMVVYPAAVMVATMLTPFEVVELAPPVPVSVINPALEVTGL